MQRDRLAQLARDVAADVVSRVAGAWLHGARCCWAPGGPAGHQRLNGLRSMHSTPRGARNVQVVGCGGPTGQQALADALQARGGSSLPAVVVLCTNTGGAAAGTPEAAAAELQQVADAHAAVAVLGRRQVTVYAVAPDTDALLPQQRRQLLKADVGTCDALCQVWRATPARGRVSVTVCVHTPPTLVCMLPLHCQTPCKHTDAGQVAGGYPGRLHPVRRRCRGHVLPVPARHAHAFREGQGGRRAQRVKVFGGVYCDTLFAETEGRLPTLCALVHVTWSPGLTGRVTARGVRRHVSVLPLVRLAPGWPVAW